MRGEPFEDDDALIDDYMERRDRAVVKPARPNLADRKKQSAKRETVTSLILLGLLLVSIYVFWVFPHQRCSQKVQVEFEQKK